MQLFSSIATQHQQNASRIFGRGKGMPFLTPFFQPKQISIQSNGAYRQEVVATAESVMDKDAAEKATQPFFRPATTVIQPKCAHCEEEEREQLQKKESNHSAPTTTNNLDSYIASLSGGRSLSKEAKAFFEPRMGYDFSEVKVHTDAAAARSAQSVNALAYTTGSNIVFNSGQYAPDTENGKRLLGHELTHVVQQNFQLQSIQRFGSSEHRQMGDTAVGGNVLVTAYGTFSFGEMVAMAGDYFANIEQIASLAESHVPSDREQIDYVLWKVNPTRPRPTVSQTAIDLVEDRYNRLAASNESHFSTGSSAGNTNRDFYVNLHTQAINDAFMEGFNPLVVRRWNWHAREAFAQHYLTDAFSAGHVRTERGNIQRYWNGMYPNFIDNMIRMISCYMASHVNDRDNVGYIYTVDGLTDEIVPVVRSIGGSKLTSFSIGDMISKVLHDADNAGLDVISPRGPAGSTTGSPFHWRAVGDENLFPSSGTAASIAQQQTQQMMTEAMWLSNDECRQAYSAGTSYDVTTRNRLTNQVNFRALELIPSVDTASTSNPVYVWRAPNLASLSVTIQLLIRAAFAPGAEVRRGLDSIAVDCITTKSGFDLHTRDAFECFKCKLLANVWGTILEIAAGTPLCPPGQNDFCPTLRNPCPYPASPAHC